MLDDAIYVTCGDFSIAAIKEDGTLWTWGNNTFGSCGYDCGDEDFIEEPVMVLEDVKMVWMDEARFDTLEERLSYGISSYTCDYTYVTFVEKNDGSLLACGYEVEGEGSKSWTYMLYGDILRTSNQMNGGVYEAPVTVSYSDIFQRIEFCEKDRQPQLQFKELEFGMSSEEVSEFLDGLNIDYKIVDGISEEEKVYEIVTEDQYFTFYFDEKHELTAIYYSAYGTRNGKITIGMTRKEVEAALNQSCFDEIYVENDRYITAFYQVSDGAQRYRRYAEYLHASWAGGCNGRTAADGGFGECEKGTGKEQRGEARLTENVPGDLIIERTTRALLRQGIFLFSPTGRDMLYYYKMLIGESEANR